MSLRTDAVYRVDLRTPVQVEKPGSPPKVVQIRLTEQALQQLANAYSSSDNAGIRIDVDPRDPLLIIGDTQIALHAPLLASSSQSGKSTTASDAGGTSTAPNELYRLSADESTLHRIGTISTKLSVKPTRDVSAVAQRLKQQKEEEEHRKEERRRALMQGADSHPVASPSAKSGINKTLANARGLGGLSSSTLGRSSSLNKLSSRREPDLGHSSLSRGYSRDSSPGARPGSSTGSQARSKVARHDESAGIRRSDRAFTDSPKVSATTSVSSSRRLLDPNHSTTASEYSRTEHRGYDMDRLDDVSQTEPKAQLSSPASGTPDMSKKTVKLTTRQRLAKATKAGSRLLAASDRNATPERRTASATVTQGSPPSKAGLANQHPGVESTKVRPPSDAPSHPSSKANAKDQRAADADADSPAHRKRRRTNDFASSDFIKVTHERKLQMAPDEDTPVVEYGSTGHEESSCDEKTRQTQPMSLRGDRDSRSIPVSASMPSFTSMSTRLPTVAERAGRDASNPQNDTYRDRRRDRSYDEARHDEHLYQERDATSNQDRHNARRGWAGNEHVRTSSRGAPRRSGSAEFERPIKGVGPGATHWSEPWLNVRSKADWHRLAQRFRKMQDEYFLSRQRLEAESKRLEQELELASVEEQTKTHDAEFPAEPSLLFSPHKSTLGARGSSGAVRKEHRDVEMGEVEKATAINTVINSRTPGSKSKAEEDGDESPEEGEMRSSDDETPTSDGNAIKLRSESPESLAWRSSSKENTERPLSYGDLAERVKQLEELHGGLSRMHRVLVEFKNTSGAPSIE